MFRYERVNLIRKFTVIAEIVSLLKKIYKRDGPLKCHYDQILDIHFFTFSYTIGLS